jgi:glycosyltransferase involved in cell wall biosynthesis
VHFLFISTMEGVPWGGSEELWSQAAAELLKRGHRVSFCTKFWNPTPELLVALQKNGAKAHFRRSKPLPWRLVDRLHDPMKALLRRTKPDLAVMSQGSNSDGLHWMLASGAFSLPYAPIAQCAIPWFWPPDAAAEQLRRAYAGARRAYFVSEENIGLTERHVGSALPNAEVVRNPFKVPYGAVLPWPNGDEYRLGFVARLDTYIKGHDLLFDVLDQPKWRDRPLTVTLYGDGPNKKAIMAEQEERGLKNVRFGGFVRNPVEIWGIEHCLILPSRAEGLPLAIVEAMLCSRPCIVTNVSGNAELLEDNVTGFLARAATVDDLDEAMERAWATRGLWQEMGQRAAIAVRETVPSNPAEVFADKLLSLL